MRAAFAVPAVGTDRPAAQGRGRFFTHRLSGTGLSMSFFIQNAYAAAEPAKPAAGGSIFFYVTIVVLFAVFWFFLIRPQQKKQKEHQKMLSAIGKDDEVITNGGMLGRVKELSDQFITLEVAQGVEVRVQRQAIGAIVPRGTLKHSKDSTKHAKDSLKQSE